MTTLVVEVGGALLNELERNERDLGVTPGEERPHVLAVVVGVGDGVQPPNAGYPPAVFSLTFEPTVFIQFDTSMA